FLGLALATAARAQTARPFEITDNSFLIEEAFNQEAGVVQSIGTLRMDARHAGVLAAVLGNPADGQQRARAWRRRHRLAGEPAVQRAGRRRLLPLERWLHARAVRVEAAGRRQCDLADMADGEPDDGDAARRGGPPDAVARRSRRLEPSRLAMGRRRSCPGRARGRRHDHLWSGLPLLRVPVQSLATKRAMISPSVDESVATHASSIGMPSSVWPLKP